MRKASKIIYLVAGILSVVGAVFALGFGLFFVLSPYSEAFIESAKEAYKTSTTTLSFDEFLVTLQATMVTSGVFCFIFGVACGGVNSFLSFKAYAASKNGKPSKTLNVLNIVFGVLSCVEVNIAAAIFAFVANGQEERRAAVNDSANK